MDAKPRNADGDDLINRLWLAVQCFPMCFISTTDKEVQRQSAALFLFWTISCHILEGCTRDVFHWQHKPWLTPIRWWYAVIERTRTLLRDAKSASKCCTSPCKFQHLGGSLNLFHRAALHALKNRKQKARESPNHTDHPNYTVSQYLQAINRP